MVPELSNWLLQQMNADDSMDGVSLVVKLAVQEFGPKAVAQELRRLAVRLERHGDLAGWKFPGSN